MGISHREYTHLCGEAGKRNIKHKLYRKYIDQIAGAKIMPRRRKASGKEYASKIARCEKSRAGSAGYQTVSGRASQMQEDDGCTSGATLTTGGVGYPWIMP